MAFNTFDDRSLTEDVDGCYPFQSHLAMSESDDKLAADHDMGNMFDFPGYHDGYQSEQMDSSPQQQNYSRTQHDQLQQDPASFQPQDSDADDDELRILMNAAHVSYYSSHLLQSNLVPLYLSNCEEDLVDPPRSVDVEDLTKLDMTERWAVDKTTMDFLASVIALSAPTDSFSARCDIRPDFRGVKLDEPVLQSDAAMDMLRLRERNVTRLDAEGIGPFNLDKRHDQDLKWSSKNLKLPNEMEKLLATEKMNVNNETGTFLKEVFGNMEGDLITSLMKDRQRKAPMQPVTPPLLPLTPPYSPGEMPSTAAQLQFTSTPEDPLIREAAELEAQIMLPDDAEHTDEYELDGSDTYSLLKDPVGSSSSPLRRKMNKISDLKVSSPLLPLEVLEPPTKKAKTVSFAEELESLVPHRDSDAVSTDPFMAADEAFAAITAMVEPLAQTVMRRADNERLIEIDTTARVDVRPIEDVVLVAPWETYAGRQRALLEDTRADITKTEKKWSGASTLERLLPWSPFPAHLGKPKPEREFDDGSLARYLSELDIEGTVDLQPMVWKPSGLRVVDFNEYDDEKLEVSDFVDASERPRDPETQASTKAFRDPAYTTSLHFSPPSFAPSTVAAARAPAQVGRLPNRPTPLPSVQSGVNSMQALLENRRQQLQHEKKALEAIAVPDANGDLSATSGLKSSADRTSTEHRQDMPDHQGGLSTFMALQGIHEKPPVANMSMEPKAHQETRRPEPAPILAKPVLEIPAPQIDIPNSTLPIVLSSTVMAKRQLVRKLQQRLPSLMITERDLTSGPNLSIGKQGQSPPLATEADLTLSPSTGLVFSTLQKLKQRPLPGEEASFIGFREQIGLMAPRYERLLVLVSEGSTSASETQTHIRILDERDSAAIVDLIGSFVHLDTEVQVSYVPGGDEELANWIAAAIVRYAPHIEDFNLLDAETGWERFLRKAGMNVFAAQVVLSRVKQPETDPDSESSTMLTVGSSRTEVWGLAAIVTMDVEERVQRFGALIGGVRMLRRVSMSVDGSWKVASRGR